MRVRTVTLCIAAVPALVLASLAHANGFADPDYPQASHSTMSRDAVAADAMRANNSMHATEVLESQVATPVSGLDARRCRPRRSARTTACIPPRCWSRRCRRPWHREACLQATAANKRPGTSPGCREARRRLGPRCPETAIPGG
jgi:hypothetical protein